jgi:hypothetical protein
LRRATVEAAGDCPQPIGFKIGTSSPWVRCWCRRIREIPIHFSQRHAGRSKQSLRVQSSYLRQLLGLYALRARRPSRPR